MWKIFAILLALQTIYNAARCLLPGLFADIDEGDLSFADDPEVPPHWTLYNLSYFAATSDSGVASFVDFLFEDANNGEYLLTECWLYLPSAHTIPLQWRPCRNDSVAFRLTQNGGRIDLRKRATLGNGGMPALLYGTSRTRLTSAQVPGGTLAHGEHINVEIGSVVPLKSIYFEQLEL